MDISRWIERHAQFTPDKPAIRFEGRDITYADFAERVRHYARALKHEFGIGRGDRVAFLGPSTPECLILFFAAARLGAIYLPLNWRLAPPEHVFIVNDAAPKILICDADYQAHAEEIRGEIADCVFASVGFEDAEWQSIEAPDGDGDDFNPHVDEASACLLVYTSGTTGRPKGAVLDQRAILVNALNSVHMHEMTGDDRILTAIPLFHVGGLNVQTTPALFCGATVILHRRFDPNAVLEDIQTLRPTLMVSVPATMDALLRHPDWAATDLTCFKSITTGSSIVPTPLIHAVHERNVPVIQVYGSTETAPVCIYQRRADAMKVGSTGKAALLSEVRIVDDDGADVAQGQSGEILIRGGNNFFEYWGDAEATAAALKDGWFYSGDIGYMDEDSDIFVNDRKKDLIISGGENIYPAEIEAVLHEMMDIADATVVGRADEKWGEVPVAVLVPAEGETLAPEEILGRFDGVLARYKHPKDVVFVDELPRNVMGKILKFEVREMLAGES